MLNSNLFNATGEALARVVRLRARVAQSREEIAALRNSLAHSTASLRGTRSLIFQLTKEVARTES
jgi:hypothetical protein